MGSGLVRHLYAHVPFCVRRCAYCDFASESVEPHRRRGMVERYMRVLSDELEEREPLLADRLATAYIGGGTPTAVGSEQLLPLVAEIGRRTEAGGELTVEANPGTLTADFVAALRAHGMTRLSLGVQSFDSRLREELGRAVSDEAIEAAMGAVADVGLESWNLDLIFGIPGQTWESARRDVDRAVASGAPHVSLYDLTYTRSFDRRIHRRRGPGARSRADEFAEKAYARVVSRLEEAGLRRYEVSNFARPGHESRHNLGYWLGEDYVGIGASAVSTVGLERRTNPRAVRDYVAGRPGSTEALDGRTRLFERAMLGLRTADGVEEGEITAVLDREAVQALAAQGFIEWTCGRLRLTRRGLDLSNAVLASVLT